MEECNVGEGAGNRSAFRRDMANVAFRAILRYAVAYERTCLSAAKSRIDVARRYRAAGRRRAGEARARRLPTAQRVVWNVRRLIDAAKILGLPVVGTEQYPKGLGPTVAELAERLGPMPSKLTFSCGGCPEIVVERPARTAASTRFWSAASRPTCASQQTVLDLLADGWRVYVAVDAVGSRFEIDYRTALGRMDSAGATLTTTEAAMFEWCEAAGTPEFKQISRLAREQGPGEGLELGLEPAGNA